MLSRIPKAQGVFSELWEIQRSSSISTRSKIRSLKSNVKSVLMKTHASKLQTFDNKSLRKICKNRTQYQTKNYRIQTPINLEIKSRRRKWIAHTLRKHPIEIRRQALQWNPQGTRVREMPKHTFRRTIKKYWIFFQTK